LVLIKGNIISTNGNENKNLPAYIMIIAKIIDKMMSIPEKWKKNKYFGMTKQEIKNLWNENGRKAASAGTKMHYDIECFYNNMEVDNPSIEYEYFLRFHKQNNDLEAYRTEWMVYDKELRFAGSIDMVFENPDGSLEIYDWKRCKEIKKENKWQSSTTECISHLPDTNFWHYSLQLNTYKALLEKNYGKKVKGLYLICLHPDNKNNSYQKIKVPTLKTEIKELFELRKKMLSKKEIDWLNNYHTNVKNNLFKFMNFEEKARLTEACSPI